MKCVEGTWTEDGSKWPKEHKRRSEVRENEFLNEKIKEYISAKKMDRRKLSKWKNQPTDALENLMGKKERQSDEALKI